MRILFLFLIGVVCFLLPSLVKAQGYSTEPVMNAQAAASERNMDRRWQEMYENKPTAFFNEERIDPEEQRQQALERLKEEEKKIPSPLWGDTRGRREARKARAEAIKEQQKALSEGKEIDPKDKIPPVLDNARSRRQARIEKYELRKKEEELNQEAENK